MLVVALLCVVAARCLLLTHAATPAFAAGAQPLPAARVPTRLPAARAQPCRLRRVVAFVPPGKPEVSVAVTIQFISPDFTA